ncbi:cold-shock protein [Methylocystis sp. L43]|jgi:CspA family cold shock protein|uniref:cold-shock protein n=1 Tax=unclassified Methylocystis TaxID=2625913 RepID=UPI0018C2ECBC|nr:MULTISPECIES: cold shock domain-containing protein [unclassified Methylocystis]MBG0799895.1 cold-shock protein [Methylocystis sp. L43]MBG0807678.1 cold-shock protein [Methylocystis sp. H15]
MQLGTVRYYSPERGFGFVRPESGGASIFVHFSVFQRAGIENITPGSKVYFETGADPRRGTEWVEEVELASLRVRS